jgi:DNA invertase Pin-like site-specific DNA recombinase
MMDATAQLEEGMIRARLDRGRARKESGRIRGREPLNGRHGFAPAREGTQARLAAGRDEQAIIARIVASRADGLSARAIAGRLNAEGSSPCRSSDLASISSSPARLA